MIRLKSRKGKNLIGYALTLMSFVQFNIVMDTIGGAHINLGINLWRFSLGLSFGIWDRLRHGGSESGTSKQA